MIRASLIPMFDNLAIIDYNAVPYDFHNEYDIERISCIDEQLVIRFVSIENNQHVSMVFHAAELCLIELNQVDDDNAAMVLDTLYRGRKDLRDGLVETSTNGKGYFYLELYGGSRVEFWASGVSIVAS